MGANTNRSRAIEEAIVAFVADRKRRQRDTSDRTILDREADALNREMAEVLDFQTEP